MNGAKLAGLAVIAILLFTTVGAANVVTTADRTALNGEFVSETIEEENAYESIRNATIDEVLDRFESANLSDGQDVLQAGNGTDNRTLVENAVTREYIRSQTDENVEALYAYLNGERSELDMNIDLRPLKSNLAEAFGQEVANKETSALVAEFSPDEEETPVPIDADLVERMQQGPQEYQEARLDFRVDVVFAVTNNDQKLILIGEDPRQYSESEKERIVTNRETEIRSVIRDELERNPDVIEINGERIDVQNEIDQRQQEAKNEACDRTREKLNASASTFELCNGYNGGVSGGTAEDNLTQAAVQFQYVIIDGLSEEFYSYEQFDTELNASEEAVANETADLAEVRIEEEVPDTLSAEDQFGSDTTNQLENAKSGVSTAGLAALLLPIAALVLVVLAYALTRSVETTAKLTGGVLVVVGALQWIVATALVGTVTSEVESAVSGTGAEQFADVLVALVERVLSALATQSLALFLVGVVLIALVAANNRGHLDGLKAKAGIGTAGGAAGGAAGQQPRQGQQQYQQGQQQHQQQQYQQGQQRHQPQDQQGQHRQQQGQHGQQQQQPQHGQQRHQPQDQQSGQNQGQSGQNQGHGGQNQGHGGQNQGHNQEHGGGQNQGHNQGHGGQNQGHNQGHGGGQNQGHNQGHGGGQNQGQRGGQNQQGNQNRRDDSQ